MDGRNVGASTGRGAIGANARQSHEQSTGTAKAHDAQAGALRAHGMSVSGTTLVKHDHGSKDNSHFWHVNVRGPEVLINWGKLGSSGKSEVKHYPDALLAEAWASDSVAEKLKSGYVVDDEPNFMREEGIPRDPHTGKE